jgi:hypothetical protein
VLDVVGVSTHHTLHTTATLFDCDAGRLAWQSVLEILARPVSSDQEDAALTGALRSTPVDLFARRTLRWVQTRQGAWVLSLGAQHGTLRLRPDGPETWQVVQVRRDTEPVRLGNTRLLPYAQGLAEDYARHLGVARLVETETPWCQHPATEKQTALLRKLGMAPRAGLTKGEAAELLAVVLGIGTDRFTTCLRSGCPTQGDMLMSLCWRTPAMLDGQRPRHARVPRTRADAHDVPRGGSSDLWQRRTHRRRHPI